MLISITLSRIVGVLLGEKMVILGWSIMNLLARECVAYRCIHLIQSNDCVYIYKDYKNITAGIIKTSQLGL
jgi:xanthosine utilization system XapX-like protein